MTESVGASSAEASSPSPCRIAFSHARSELLVVKSVRAYAERSVRDLAHQLAEVSAWIEAGQPASIRIPSEVVSFATLGEWVAVAS